MRWTGEDLRRARVEAGLLQGDVAAGAGMPRWRISELERNSDRMVPTFEEERRLKQSIHILGDLERRKREFLNRHAHERHPRKRKLPDVPDEQEATPEPALP